MTEIIKITLTLTNLATN